MAKHIPAFVKKLYFMLEKTAAMAGSPIQWANDGMSFYIYSHCDLALHVLPKFFHDTKLASFERQLHHFGFHKLRGSPDEYSHINFQRGNFAGLKHIQPRRRKNELSGSSSVVVQDIDAMMADIQRKLLSAQRASNDVAQFLDCFVDNKPYYTQLSTQRELQTLEDIMWSPQVTYITA
ncbi:unnamed protein product [Aphanomyces euteiches]|uniref:HSF-type DNA-binding domain-containing protein n=1 Tax=Aphanomyces euteiches TaxID=100861 RepID=A0A6G0X847_9STRA|nr:hypothetical protein Ae201684_007202 [Aphanomyces euteiches]KAH9100509.1 hypothetical protein Ae201684P_006706 [Aphanomyces euteiches]KAH9139303.1 hypothetical protein AeRB84_016423 [Aphanomyces euteiches]